MGWVRDEWVKLSLAWFTVCIHLSVMTNTTATFLTGFQEEESPSLANLDELRRQLPNVPPTAPPRLAQIINVDCEHNVAI